ncbi:hypothetical protein HJFPF1_08021 [Paramyrothecium foliicola]|nr:hypothetical protein HJFPF1_08021 [Paramyrothecium foliicola]
MGQPQSWLDGFIAEMMAPTSSYRSIQKFIFREGYRAGAAYIVTAVLLNHIRRILTPWLGQFLWYHAVSNMKLARSSPHYFLHTSTGYGWWAVVQWAMQAGLLSLCRSALEADIVGLERAMLREEERSVQAADGERRKLVMQKKKRRRPDVVADAKRVLYLWLLLTDIERSYAEACWAGAHIYAVAKILSKDKYAERAYTMRLLVERWERIPPIAMLLWRWLCGTALPNAARAMGGLRTGYLVPVLVHGLVWYTTAYLVRYSNKYFVLLEMSDMWVTSGWMVVGMFYILSLPNSRDSSSRPCKKQKKTHESSREIPRAPYGQYTIAWICALHVEMAAAQAMLDSIHVKLPIITGDGNNYTCGNIQHHNIVLACLPTSQYGTNSAANVLTNLVRSFPSIRYCLLVGIGGGAPTKVDIRLGDIVVGTRVVQHDLGKVTGENYFERKKAEKYPAQLFLTAASNLRANHELKPSQVTSILEDKFAEHPEYRRPSLPDCLFKAAYSHREQIYGCNDCDSQELVKRDPRSHNDPVIHYGGVASGNQVMRYGPQRDSIAQDLDVVCFEMEAAGLMDILPCLCVRGICDYSDSHKNKDWQRYAAAAAAAYARELLEHIPLIIPDPNITDTFPSRKWNYPSDYRIVKCSHQDYQEKPSDHYAKLLASLKFHQMNSRKAAIDVAHDGTCGWFLHHPHYKSWSNPIHQPQQQSILLINGKSGAGKSTMMKFIFENMYKAHHEAALISGFFFNAQGALLERSAKGMYRFLLLTILEGYPDLQLILGDLDCELESQTGWSSLQYLRNLFSLAVLRLRDRPFICFIDGLDECDEQDVTEMVQHLEELTEQAKKKEIVFRICLSTRPYPGILTDRATRLTLEDYDGHTHDMAVFVQSRLRIADPKLVQELQSKILAKAGGVFLWVVMVVNLLNKENRYGRLALKKELDAVPSKLSELFRSMIQRDDERCEYLQLSVIILLLTKRPLSPEEYYHALWAGLLRKGLVDQELPTTSSSDSTEMIATFITNSSKGLAEVKKAKSPIVQFIHETVRHFFIQENGINEVWPELGHNWENQSHEILKTACEAYVHHPATQALANQLPQTPDFIFGILAGKVDASKSLPFLKYACEGMLYHADLAANQIPQTEYVARFQTFEWIKLANIAGVDHALRHTQNTSAAEVFASCRCRNLIHALNDKRVSVRSNSKNRIALFATRDIDNKFLEKPAENEMISIKVDQEDTPDQPWPAAGNMLLNPAAELAMEHCPFESEDTKRDGGNKIPAAIWAQH